ncbi:MAG: DUF6089 family protein [Bacteroidota bacterium]
MILISWPVLKQFTKYATTETDARSLKDSTDRSILKFRRAIFPLLILFSLFFLVPAHGQRKSDIGIMAAVPWYLGDLSPSIPQAYPLPPALGPILRYNFNMRNALRAHAVFYNLSGSGEVFGVREAEFQSSFVDLGLDFEFNWWPYKTAFRKTKYSPYVSAGLGYSLNISGESLSHAYLPFGGGLKLNLGQKLSGGVEVSMRKSFTDLIDGITNPGGEEVQTPVGNNDWYMFTGIFLTYKIFNFREDCPTYNDNTYGVQR